MNDNDVYINLSKLKFLAKIQKDEKIECSDESALNLVGTTWMDKFWRTVKNNESREKSLGFIRKVCSKSIEIAKSYKYAGDSHSESMFKNIVSDLQAVRKSIENLIETYKIYRFFVAELEVYSEILETEIKKLEDEK